MTDDPLKKRFAYIKPPEGCEFVPCINCQMPHVKKIGDPKDEKCLWCYLHENIDPLGEQS